MFCKHLASGKAHDPSPHRGKHAHLETRESDDWSSKTCGHKESPGNGNLVMAMSYKLVF